jgi:hypothetical protein
MRLQAVPVTAYPKANNIQQFVRSQQLPCKCA